MPRACPVQASRFSLHEAIRTASLLPRIARGGFAAAGDAGEARIELACLWRETERSARQASGICVSQRVARREDSPIAGESGSTRWSAAWAWKARFALQAARKRKITVPGQQEGDLLTPGGASVCFARRHRLPAGREGGRVGRAASAAVERAWATRKPRLLFLQRRGSERWIAVKMVAKRSSPRTSSCRQSSCQVLCASNFLGSPVPKS